MYRHSHVKSLPPPAMRPRTRPTREETRDRLLDGAARVFVDKGIGAATIEDICDEAGFSRGAFYSNFEAKDELVMALLDRFFTVNELEIERLYGISDDPEDFIRSMGSSERRLAIPFGDPARLYMELTLHAMRNPDNRPQLIERQRRSLANIAGFIERIAEQLDIDVPGGVDDAAHLLLAFDSGLILNSLIDPELHDPDRWSRTVLALHRLWTAATEG